MKNYLNLKILLPYIKKSKVYFVMGILGMIFVSAITAPIPYYIGEVLDIVVMNNASFQNIQRILLLILGIYVLKFSANIVYQFFFTKLQQNIVNNIRITMIEKIIDAPLHVISCKENGYILSRIGEVQQIGAIFSPTILSSFAGIFEIGFCLVMMFSINVKLSIIAVLILPIYYVISKFIARKITETTIRLQEDAAKLNGNIYETLNGVEEIKLLNMKIVQLKKIGKKVKAMVESAINQSLAMIGFIQGISLASDLVTIGVLALAGFLIIKGEITIGIYTAFSLYIGKILGVTQSVGTFEVTIKPICATINRIKEFLDLESELPDNPKKFTQRIEKVSFQNVSFGYDEKNLVLSNFTETFVDDDRVLLIGKNGSGKTTLIKLLTGLYNPNKGEILFNDIRYSEISKTEIRERIGIVSQNIFLFKGSVAENILFGAKEKTEIDINNLIKKFKLDDYISSLPERLHTNIIQDGLGVSGGQAQIIAFLRAVIGEKDILILDEATSNMDRETSRKIVNILGENKLCKIIFVISHQQFEYKFINKIVYL